MPFFPLNRRSTAAGAALVLLAVACGDDGVGPQFSDPQQLEADLATVAGVFDTPIFQSFTLASENLSGSAPAPAAALLRATRPEAPSRPYADAPERIEAMRRLLVALSPTATAGVIPQSEWGKTFVWDPVTHQYVADPNRPGADPMGVRVVLYQLPIEPSLTEIGYVDLIDVSTGSTNGLRVVIVGTVPEPDVEYADYTITATANPPSSFSASAAGSVSDGTRTLEFSATWQVTGADTDNPDFSFDATFTLDVPPVSIHVAQTVTTPDANHVTLTIDFSVTRGGEEVSLSGTISLTVTTTGESLTANLTIRINGGVFARISGTDENIAIRHPNGREFTQQELEELAGVLLTLFSMPDFIDSVLGDLFNPARHFMGV